MAKRNLPAKVERCVMQVKARGYSKTSAIKICQASVGGKKKSRRRK